MPHLTPDPTPAIASTGSADVPSAAPPSHTNPTPLSPSTPFVVTPSGVSSALAAQSATPSPINPQSAISNPQSLDLSHPAGMERLHLIAALAETKVITAFNSLDALAPADQLFHDRLASAIQGGYRATAMRKTVILLDSHFEALAQARQVQADAQAASEAEQARLAARREADAQAQAELHLKAINRAEELVTRLAAQDPYLRQALEETHTDLAELFNRLRHPEPEPAPAPASPDQKEIDEAAKDLLYDLFNKLRHAHPETQWGFANAAYHASELARVDRGEPDPRDFDDDDDMDDEDDDFEDDDDFTGSADVSSASANVYDDATDNTEDAAPLGPRTASSATAPGSDDATGITENPDPSNGSADALVRRPAPARPHGALAPFNPQTAICNWRIQPATNNEQQPTTNEQSANSQSSIPHSSIRNQQSAIRNCVVPSCPTLSPRRLQALLDASIPECEPTQLVDSADALPNIESQTAPQSTPNAATPAEPRSSILHTDSASPTIDNEQLAIDIRTIRARARPGF